MPKVIKLGCLLSLLVLGSCGRSGSLGPQQYAQYLEAEQHGLSRKVTSGIYEYTIQLATPEYMVSKEMADADSSYHAATRLKELQGHLFFLIRIGKTEAYRKQAGGNEQSLAAQQADAMVAYYDQQAAADITLKAGSRVLQPVTYHFENNYGLTAYNTIVAGFETGAVTGDLQLSFNDRFAHEPLIQAGFEQQQLAALPTLQTN